jgi:hypothetical protein
MTKKLRQALDGKGYTADEIEMLLNSFTDLRDKLRKEARTSSRDGDQRPS